jgi:hypothetical protein
MKKDGSAEKRDIPTGFEFELGGERHQFLRWGKSMALCIGGDGLLKAVNNQTVLDMYSQGSANA